MEDTGGVSTYVCIARMEWGVKRGSGETAEMRGRDGENWAKEWRNHAEVWGRAKSFNERNHQLSFMCGGEGIYKYRASSPFGPHCDPWSVSSLRHFREPSHICDAKDLWPKLFSPLIPRMGL